jgi:hypothetical protein
VNETLSVGWMWSWSKGLVEVNNMPIGKKKRQETLKPVQMPPERPERSCAGLNEQRCWNAGKIVTYVIG